MTKTDEFEKAGDPTFWTLLEAAEDLRVSHHILRRAIRENKLPAKLVGNRYRVTPADVRRFAATELADA